MSLRRPCPPLTPEDQVSPVYPQRTLFSTLAWFRLPPLLTVPTRDSHPIFTAGRPQVSFPWRPPASLWFVLCWRPECPGPSREVGPIPQSPVPSSGLLLVFVGHRFTPAHSPFVLLAETFQSGQDFHLIMTGQLLKGDHFDTLRSPV